MTEELRASILANQDGVEAFCWKFQQWLGADINSRDAFAAELLLREALVNGVEHGCHGGDGHEVLCVVRGGKGRIFVFVKDPGAGFDWKNLWNFEVGGDACSGRGIQIYKTYGTQVRFNRAGNSVFIKLKLKQKMERN